MHVYFRSETDSKAWLEVFTGTGCMGTGCMVSIGHDLPGSATNVALYRSVHRDHWLIGGRMRIRPDRRVSPSEQLQALIRTFGITFAVATLMDKLTEEFEEDFAHLCSYFTAAYRAETQPDE